jgi:hypothetical protein
MSDTGKLTNKARDWLLAILRFAVTLERNDRVAVLAMARELDRPGMGEAATTFAFFTRTSLEFCNAIADKNDPNRTAILLRHIARIEDHRLKRALEAAIDLGPEAMRALPRNPWQSDLWRGLPSARHG